ncbi:MAG: AAA family ATPase [Methyloprofundus sp.]|nr:AAA family ATPase [Methyloprofundus sp.]
MKVDSVSSVRIKNFKGFEDFSIDGLKQVNLIGGKNNIGKTAFMEALQLILGRDSAVDVAAQISKILERRQKTLADRNRTELEMDLFYNGKESLDIQTDKSRLRISLEKDLWKIVDTEKRSVNYLSVQELDELDGFDPDRFEVSYEEQLRIKIGRNERIIPVHVLSRSRSNYYRRNTSDNISEINFISSATTDENQIAILYGSLVDANKEQYLNESLSLFDESITALKQVAIENGVLLKLATKYQEKLVLLSSFGEGINRYIAILCAIWANKDGYLFIDEVENGIHYSNYPKLWRLIFEASKLANCQLFITTHSKECIEAYNEQNINDAGRYFEFYRNNKTHKVTAKPRDLEQLDYALKHQGEIRGE